MADEQKENRKKIILSVMRTLVIVLAAVIFCYAAFRLIKIWMEYRQNEAFEKEMEDILGEDSDEDFDSEDPLNPVDPDNPDAPADSAGESKSGNNSTGGKNNNSKTGSSTSSFSKLSHEKKMARIDTLDNKYKDLVGALIIPVLKTETHMVVQGKNNEEYLHHDINKKYRYSGTFFVDYRVDASLKSRNTNLIIFGHRMKDGSMLGQLGDYWYKASVMKAHPTFTYVTKDAVYECQIFAVYKTTIDFNYLKVKFSSDKDFLDFVAQCRKQSKYDLSSVKIQAGDNIITLSTCDGTIGAEGEGRLVVQAKLVKIASRQKEESKAPDSAAESAESLPEEEESDDLLEEESDCPEDYEGSNAFDESEEEELPEESAPAEEPPAENSTPNDGDSAAGTP